MKNYKLFALLLISNGLLLLFASNCLAETEQEKGLRIATIAAEKDEGWKSVQSELVMTLVSNEGKISIRRITSQSLEVLDDGDKTLLIFEEPKDIQGTTFLSYSHPLKADEQWIFLPALKRVKRISSSNKSGPFMGSEFSYEDISSQEVDKYAYKYIKDEIVNGRDSFVIERYPKYQDSGYARQMVWLDKKMYQPSKIVFYDKRNDKLKTLTYYSYQLYVNKHWRPGKLTMVNHQNGRKTHLEWKEYQFHANLNESDFSRSRLSNLH